MIGKIKTLFKKAVYPNCYSSEALIGYMRKKGAVIGKNTHIYSSAKHRIDVEHSRFIEIGDNCLITNGVVILAHDYSYAVLVNAYHELVRKQRITKIGNNVFIGMNAIILMGAEIGDNTIIGAGSVVSGKLEGNAVYAGNPAKRICSLDEYRQKMNADYENSARICASKCSKPEQLEIYRSLFEDRESFMEYFRSMNFRGIDPDVLNDLKFESPHWDWNNISHL
ncbi:MAG: acyltransferase [Ruminococcus sp.]|nr:acyltransferase [Ruminococcus sp.]